MRSFLHCLLLCVPVVAGCYDSHTVFGVRRDGGGPLPSRDGSSPVPGTDGAPVPVPTDGGGPPPGFDGGPIARRDAGPGVDAGPLPDAGTPSRALAFGTGDVLVVADGPGLDLVEQLTYEMWIRPAATGSGTISVKGGRRTGLWHYGVALEGNELVVGWGTTAGPREIRAPIAREVWTHVAVVIAPVDPMLLSMRLVVNGDEVAEGVFPADLTQSLNDMPLEIGGGGYVGDVDEVRLWRLARLTSDIRATMRTRIGGGIAGLEGYWPLEEGGQLALDRTAHGHDAVLGRLTVPDRADPEWIDDGPRFE